MNSYFVNGTKKKITVYKGQGIIVFLIINLLDFKIINKKVFIKFVIRNDRLKILRK